jgi:hypothetical protein
MGHNEADDDVFEETNVAEETNVVTETNEMVTTQRTQKKRNGGRSPR